MVWGQKFRESAILLALFLIPFAVYWPIVAWPYLLMDDNWLLRGWSETGYPSSEFIAILQGRAALAGMAWLSSFPITVFGEPGIQIFRLTGIAALGLCAVLTYFYTRHLPLPKPFRFLAAALWITLPSTQVIISNGSWLTMGIAAAIGAVLILLQPITWTRISFAALLLWFAAATYQPCFFIAPALYVLTLYDAKNWRQALVPLGVMVVALGAYFVAWKTGYSIVFPNFAENRYSPNALLPVDEWTERIHLHLQGRLGTVIGLWGIPAGFPDIASHFRSAFWALIALTAAVYVWRNLLNPLRGIKNLWPLILIPIAIVAAEIPSMLSTTMILSYTTAIGSTFVVSMGGAGLLSYVTPRQLSVPVAAAILIFGGTLASVSSYRHFALPTYLNQQATKAHLIKRIAETPTGPLILCYTSQAQGYGSHEFSWTNFGHPFWAYWHVRSVMNTMLRQDSSRVQIVMRDVMKRNPDEVMPSGTNPSCRDEEFLDLPVNSKADWFLR